MLGASSRLCSGIIGLEGHRLSYWTVLAEWSASRDLNSGPPPPEGGALAWLRYLPLGGPADRAQTCTRLVKGQGLCHSRFLRDGVHRWLEGRALHPLIASLKGWRLACFAFPPRGCLHQASHLGPTASRAGDFAPEPCRHGPHLPLGQAGRSSSRGFRHLDLQDVNLALSPLG